MPSDADFILIFLAGLLVSTRGRRGPTPVLTTNAFAFSRADLNFNLMAPANVRSYVYPTHPTLSSKLEACHVEQLDKDRSRIPGYLGGDAYRFKASLFRF